MPRFNSSGGAAAVSFRSHGIRQAKFRVVNGTVNANAIAKPAGIQVGDLVALLGYGNPVALDVQTQGGAVWAKSADPSTGLYALYTKILNATDVANAWQDADGNGIYAIACVYNPNVAVTAMQVSACTQGLSVAGNFDIPGVSAAHSRGIVAFCVKESTGVSPTPPANFTTRAGSTFNACDKLNGSYSGQNIRYTGCAAGNHFGWTVKFL